MQSTKEHDRVKGVQTDVEWLKGLVTSLALRGFHGRLTINYENGRIRNMVEERSHKPPK